VEKVKLGPLLPDSGMQLHGYVRISKMYDPLPDRPACHCCILPYSFRLSITPLNSPAEHVGKQPVKLIGIDIVLDSMIAPAGASVNYDRRASRTLRKRRNPSSSQLKKDRKCHGEERFPRRSNL
jgi:hypothetical protein